MVVEAGTFQAAVVEFEPQGVNEVQPAACVGTEAYDIAGIGRYLRLEKYNIKHVRAL